MHSRHLAGLTLLFTMLLAVRLAGCGSESAPNGATGSTSGGGEGGGGAPAMAGTVKQDAGKP